MKTKISWFIFFLIFFTSITSFRSGYATAVETGAVRGTVTVVSTWEQLTEAIKNAGPDDRILLTDGEYTAGKITGKGTSGHPIRIEAEHKGMARIMAGQLELQQSSYLVLSGLSFLSEAGVDVRECDHLQITRCTFQLKEKGETHWVRLREDTSYIRVDHCTFSGKTQKGNYISLTGPNQVSQHDQIDHNAFLNSAPSGENGEEAIRIGVGSVSDQSAFTIVEYNLFQNCDGDAEVLSNKTSDNIIRYNTIRASTGSLSVRQGDRCQVYGNIILGDHKMSGDSASGGIKVYGAGHLIHDNFIENTMGMDARGALVLDSGDSDGTAATEGSHPRVRDVKVYNNVLFNNKVGLILGGTKYKPWMPTGCLIENNKVIQEIGTCYIVYGGEKNIWRKNVAYITKSAKAGAAGGISILKKSMNCSQWEKKALSMKNVGVDAP